MTARLFRLTVVELRKAVDTRSSRWLLAVTVVLCAVVAVLQARFEENPLERGLRGTYTAQHGLALTLLAVVGILLVTSEWSRRTALTTFTLVPRRNLVTAAKCLAMAVLAVAASVVVLAVSVVVALVGPPLGAAGSGSFDLPVGLFLRVTALGVVLGLGGVAFGLALVSTPLAIVLYFVLPIVLTVVAETVRVVRRPLGWIDANVTVPRLYLEHVSAGDWSRAAASLAVWVLLPLVIGAVRTAYREVA